MNESPNSENLPPVLNKTGKPAPSLRYRRIWFFNALATGLAIGFFISTDMGTSEFFYDSEGIDWGGLIFLAILSLFWIVPAIGMGTGIFFVTKHFLKKQFQRRLSHDFGSLVLGGFLHWVYLFMACGISRRNSDWQKCAVVHL